MKRTMTMRIPPVLIATVGLLALFLIYRSFRLDLTCSSGVEEGWMRGESSPSSAVNPQCTTTAENESAIQILREKAKEGLLNDDVAGVDFTTKALLVEAVDAVAHPITGSVGKGMFGLNYGVMRVVRRVVVCSSYRTSLREFSLITLSPEFTVFTSNPDYAGLPAKDPSIYPTCLWLQDGNAGAPPFTSIQAMKATGRLSGRDGALVFRWMNEAHGTSYDTLMIHCSFPEPVGTDAGGFLYLNISHGPVGTGAPSELVPVFHEKPNQLSPALYEASSFQYEYAYCSAPSFTSLIPSHVKQFLMYHHALFDGKVHFFFYYSAEIEEDTMAVLKPLIKAGILTLVDFSKESNYHIMYHGQAPAINDCLYRTRFLARWSLFWDLDEYLLIPSSSTTTVSELLEKHKDAPWISFGKIDFRYSHCLPSATPDQTWAVERMIYRLERPFCMDTCSAERCGEMCKSEKGMRKWIANPRKVRSAVTHSINDPKDNSAGVVLHTKVARFNHYRGLVAPRAWNSCQKIVDPDGVSSTTDVDGKTTLIKDDDLAMLVTSSLKSTAESLKIFGGTL